tara:strand:+ start:97 stop:501 length:405 start_codon:yes stop_codon:yes gene_type:complete
MIQSNIVYKNNLRTEAVHLSSGETITTDAPIDNNGKGEAFSPTDLVAAALGSCMITIMGIVAEKHNIDISGTSASVKKIMGENPRKIDEVAIDLRMSNQLNKNDRKKLERAALSCPVHKSLHPDLKKTISFSYK